MIGFGYDIHKLAKGESLILGGVPVESDVGTAAHSDGDVILHALCDALLGAAGLGDIGEHFPDNDPQYKNADSTRFVKEIMGMIENSFAIVNIDITVVLEKPKLSAYKKAIREMIAELCGISAERVNIKAATNEKMGFIGRGEGIAAFCISELSRIE